MHNLSYVLALILVVSLQGFAFGASGSESPPDVTAIVGASVVKLDGSASIQNAVVLIEGKQITAVGPSSGIQVPPNARVIHAEGKWLLPGLMNLHVHLGLKFPWEPADETEAAHALRMAANARKTLHAGVTTLRCVGEDHHADFALRDAIERGDTEGPNIFTAGRPLIVTGGHGSVVDKTYNDGPYEFRKAARREIRAGADWIKLLISGGISTPGSGIKETSYMTPDEVQAVTDIAHRHGVKVTAHSGSPVATDEAVDAGLDCVEHGYFLTEKVLRKMKKKGTWLVPTIVVSQPATLPAPGTPPWLLARMEEAGKKHWNALKTAVKVGVRIALGTDYFPFEPNDGTTTTVREAEYYVEAGMTPVQALRAGTIEAATLLGAEDQLGTIETGKQADIIAVDQDPTQDISALRNILFVMKGGRVVRNNIEPSI